MRVAELISSSTPNKNVLPVDHLGRLGNKTRIYFPKASAKTDMQAEKFVSNEDQPLIKASMGE